MFHTVKTVTIVMTLADFVAVFGTVMIYIQLPMRTTEALTGISDDKYAVLVYTSVMLLLTGTLTDMAPLTLTLTPVLLSVTSTLGIGSVHFNMITLVNLGIGLVTPPVGSVLLVANTVSKRKTEQVVRAMLSFYLTLFLVLMFMTYIPATSLFLPKLFGVVRQMPGGACAYRACKGPVHWLNEVESSPSTKRLSDEQ